MPTPTAAAEFAVSPVLKPDSGKTGILPCPFCGEPGELDACTHTAAGWVNCTSDDCLTTGPMRATDHEAITAWNQRR